jgi:hypothetical protein
MEEVPVRAETKEGDAGGVFRRRQLLNSAEEPPGQPKVGMVPPTRIERATRGLGNRCSIQLSYGGITGMLKNASSVVLASLGGLNVAETYARLLARCGLAGGAFEHPTRNRATILNRMRKV